MSEVIDFGFDDANVVKTKSVELFKQSKPGERHRVSIISFKTHHDIVLARKVRERGADLSMDEKKELFEKIDQKIADELEKPVSELTDADRLDIRSPRFSFSFTHYKDGIGTIKCLSKYEGSTLVEEEICCKHIGEPSQKIGTVIMTYPVDDRGQVDMELLMKKKYTKFYVWTFSPKKFKQLESTYADARSDGKTTVDMRVTLDGDPRYQKQIIESAGTAAWAKKNVDPEIRKWILEMGLKLHKSVPYNLGYGMKKEELIEKLGLSVGESGEEEAPKLVSSYDDMFTK